MRRQLIAGASGLFGMSAIAGPSGDASGAPPAEATGPVTSVAAFGARGDGTGDDGDALRRALAWAQARYSESGGATPRLHVPGGIYPYRETPNFAVTALALECAPGVVFRHTGAGAAFVLDGGAEGGGTYRTRILGAPMIQGNARSTIGIDVRALHHGYVSGSVRDVGVAALRTRWAVATEFHVRTSALGIGGNKPVPVDGFILDERDRLESTSACLFRLPIAEQVSNIGIRLVNAGNCTFLSGTSEANGVGGVHVGPASDNNLFVGLDLEFNGRFGLLCEGNRNGFIGMYDDKLATFAGANNWVRGHQFNAVVNRGSGNAFETIGYAAAGGSFTDTGTQTRKMLVRNLTSGRLDPDILGGYGAPVAMPTGGAVRDAEARTAIAALIARLEGLGVLDR